MKTSCSASRSPAALVRSQDTLQHAILSGLVNMFSSVVEVSLNQRLSTVLFSQRLYLGDSMWPSGSELHNFTFLY